MTISLIKECFKPSQSQVITTVSLVSTVMQRAMSKRIFSDKELSYNLPSIVMLVINFIVQFPFPKRHVVQAGFDKSEI